MRVEGRDIGAVSFQFRNDIFCGGFSKIVHVRLVGESEYTDLGPVER